MTTVTVLTSIYNSQAFLEGYFAALSRMEDKKEIEILLIHNAPNEEELTIIEKHTRQFNFLKHIVVEKKESLYASWNRGISIASGEYIAIWNVDDIRLPSSLNVQREALDKSGAAMCYGDFYGTDKYGPFKQRIYQYKEYHSLKKDVLRRHIIGCFPMWRKSIHREIGYFDEQFKLVGDFDFQIRVALRYDLVKAGSFLGYYLENQQHKLSSNRKLQDMERTIVELRYRIYDKIMLHVLPFISDFRINEMLYSSNWIKLKSMLGSSNRVTIRSVFSLISAPFTYTTWLIRKSLVRLARIIS